MTAVLTPEKLDEIVSRMRTDNRDDFLTAVKELKETKNSEIKKKVDSLIKKYENASSSNDRNHILMDLGKTGSKRAMETLISALPNRWALYYLKEIADKRAVEPLIDLLSKKIAGDYNVPEALGRIDDRRAVDPLIAA